MISTCGLHVTGLAFIKWEHTGDGTNFRTHVADSGHAMFFHQKITLHLRRGIPQ
jgi:hypothetical protein